MDTTPQPQTEPQLDPRRSLGAQGEALAARHLEDRGLEVVARNWRIASGEVRGELDLVALDHDAGVVVVCEVKTRRGEAFGGPLVAVTPRKQERIRTLAIALLTGTDLPYRRVRFDVIGILVRGRRHRLEHVEAAF